MSRREPMKQIKWEDQSESLNSYFAERSVVIAGPLGVCTITVFRRKAEFDYYITCNLLNPFQRRLTATNLSEAKSEAVDIVRILLHNILSDL